MKLLPDLLKQLSDEGFGPSYFSLSRKAPPLEGFVLERDGTSWLVYFFERGVFREVARFTYEGDACEFFYKKMHDEFGPRGKGDCH